MTRSQIIAQLVVHSHFAQLTAKEAELADKAILPNPVREHVVFCTGSVRAHVESRYVERQLSQ